MSLSCSIAIVATALGALSDAITGYIFDEIVACGLGATVVAALVEDRLAAAVTGALAGFVVTVAIRAASRGRGLGLGDVKLASVIGAGLGPLGGVVAIGSAFVVGTACVLGMLGAGRVRCGTQVRFGPYMLAGSLCDLAYHRLSTGVFP